MRPACYCSTIALLLPLLVTSPSFSQGWERVGEDNTPGGYHVALCLLEKDQYIFYGDLGDGIYRWEATSNVWTHFYLPNTNLFYDLVLFDGMIWAAIDGLGVLVSADNGETWQERNAGLTHYKVYTLTVCNNILFCGTYHGGVFRYDFGSGLWSAVNTGFPYQLYQWYAYDLGTVGEALYLSTIGIGMHYSTNLGEGWYPRNNMNYDGGAEVHGFLRSGGYLMIAADYLGVMRSIDDGESWDFCNEGINTQRYVKDLTATESAVFAGTAGAGVYMSLDNGDQWYAANLGFPWSYQEDRYSTVRSMKAIGDYLYVGVWWEGIWRANLADLYAGRLGVSENEGSVTSPLGQNFPNPFFSATEINYRVTDHGPVSLKVYDLSGKAVSTLVDRIQAPGEYKVTFAPGEGMLSPGIYYYSLVTSGAAQTRKMVLAP